MVAKTPRLLTAEQRDAFVRIPADLSERDLGRFYTLSARDLEIIGRHRRAANRLGFAVHLGLLRFPGRTLADVPEIPEPRSATAPYEARAGHSGCPFRVIDPKTLASALRQAGLTIEQLRELL
jgi:hypothetical protein